MHVDVVPGVIAGHDLVTVTADISKPKREPVTKVVRDLSTYSSDSFCSHLLRHVPTLHTILQPDDVDAQVDILTTIFTSKHVCSNDCQKNKPTLCTMDRR